MKTKDRETLAELITEFARSQPVTLDSVFARSKSVLGPLAATGYVVEIDEEAYRWFSRLLPPILVGTDYFLLAESAQPFRLFFAREKRHFALRLTWDQTRRIFDAAAIPLPGHE